VEYYKTVNIAHDKNQSLKAVPGALDLFNHIIQLGQSNFYDDISAASYQQNVFNRFIKFVFIDYAINCDTPAPVNNERTIFFENLLPIFKYFGNITKALSFR
jgi:hypothetical protein